MRIAICDDERTALESLSALLEDYILEKRIELRYEAFESYEALEDRVNEFDVFILDYKMPGLDGMTFARYLYAQYPNKTIIFVTAYDEIVFDAFAVQTHRFLMKPVDREKFFEALDSLQNSSRNGQLILKSGSTTDVIDLSHVYYIQSVCKELYVCTEKEQRVYRRSLASLQSSLESCGFFRVHRAYLVNLHHISRFDRHTLQFPNGEQVPISSRRYAAFCKAYLLAR